MNNLLFYGIVGIVVFDYLFERLLDYLNTTQWSNKLPDVLKGIYNEEEYHKSQAYKKANHKFGMITSSYSFMLILFMLLLGGFALVDGWVTGFSNHVIVSALLYFGIIGLASDILSTPFDVYDTFVIEAKSYKSDFRTSLFFL